MKQIYAEGDLVMLLVKQGLRAYSYLYDHYSKALYGVIFKLVKKEEVAQYLLQDVFVKIWKSAGQYDASKGRFFTWMLNIARRTQPHEMVELSTINYLMDTPENESHGMK